MVDEQYTKIANEILENLAKLDMSGQCFQILLIIFRLTHGYGRNSSFISLDKFVENTNGATKPRILKVISQLESRNIITRQKLRSKSVMYCFNKDVKKWIYSAEQIDKIPADLAQTDIVKKDNIIVKKDNGIDEKDNNRPQATKETDSDNNITGFSTEKKTEKPPIVFNKENNKENNKEKDLFNSDELNDKKSSSKEPQNVEPKIKKSLLENPNEALRIIGYWDIAFQNKYGVKFKHNFAKDVSISKRILNNYDENMTKNLIELFFTWVDDKDRWQYKKSTLEVFEYSLNALVVECKEIQKKQPVISENKQKNTAEKNNILQTEKKEFQTVKFDVMIQDLKKQYGPLAAGAHISDYEVCWETEIKNLYSVLKNIIKKNNA